MYCKSDANHTDKVLADTAVCLCVIRESENLNVRTTDRESSRHACMNPWFSAIYMGGGLFRGHKQRASD